MCANEKQVVKDLITDAFDNLTGYYISEFTLIGYLVTNAKLTVSDAEYTLKKAYEYDIIEKLEKNLNSNIRMVKGCL